MEFRATKFSSGVLESNADQLSRMEAEDPKDYEVYNFKDSGSGESWLIGTDFYEDNDDQWGNAYKKMTAGCPENLVVPAILTDSNGQTKPVEIIGRGAFSGCGCTKNCVSMGKTKRITVPRQVKVIKYYAFGFMHYLEAFELEPGSELEVMETGSLMKVGIFLKIPEYRTKTLILPSTLYSVDDDGIYWSDIFHTIFYCGSHLFSNSSDLESAYLPATVVKVTSQYPPNEKIFQRVPERTPETEEEAERVCQNFTTPFNFTVSEDKVTITGWWRPESELLIPSTIGGLTVIAVKENAFENCLNVTGRVFIPPTVASIGRRAFAGLRKAVSIDISGSGEQTKVELTVEEEAFAECGLDRESEGITVSLPSKRCTLGVRAFKGSKVEKVIIRE